MSDLRPVIVVEGKTDVQFLSSFVKADFVEVNGSAISRETISYISALSKKRKVIVLTDPDGNFFPDNDERAIFFARGVLETVRKLRWTPSVVHCHGWFSAIVPVYLKHVFADDPIFRDVKIVVSLYGDAFPGELDPEFRAKIEGEGIKDKNLDLLNAPSYENLCRFVMNYADGMVAASPDIDERVLDEIRKCGKPLLEYQNPEAEDFFDNYNRFYEAIQ